MRPYESPYQADKAVAETYDARVGQKWDDCDLAFYLGLAEECAGAVLELACGTGRVLLPLARAGYEVRGVDLSPHMLGVARRKLEAEPPEVQARIELIEGDMCRFRVRRRFPLILIPFRSFQSLLKRSQQRDCLKCCREHLEPDGRLVIDVFNPRLSRLAQGAVEEAPVEVVGPDGIRLQFSAFTSFDQATQTLSSLNRTEAFGVDGPALLHEGELRLRYFFRFEMEWMLEARGFEVEALYGDFERNEFAADSPEMIFVARKRES